MTVCRKWLRDNGVRLFLAGLLLLVSLVTFWSRLPPSLGIHDNTVADLLQARHCIDDGVCASAGQRSTFGGLRQGGVWPAFLVLCVRGGLDIDGVARLVVLLAALAVALLTFAASARRQYAVGILAGTCFMAGLVVVRTVMDIQWNPSLLPLPMTLFMVLLAAGFARGHWALWAGAALVGALAAQIHLLALLPLAVAVLVGFFFPPARKGLAAGVGLLLVTASLLLFSWDALTLGWQAVASGLAGGSETAFHQQMGPMVVLLLVSVAGAWVSWREWRVPGTLSLLTLYVSGCAVALLALSVGGGIALVPHYLVPFLPGMAWTLAVAAGSLAAGVATRPVLVPGALVLALATGIVLVTTQSVESATEHSFADAREVAAALRADGVRDLATAACQVRAAQRFHLLAGLSVEMPVGDPLVPCARRTPPLLVLHTPRAPDRPLPKGWRVVPSGAGWLVILPRVERLDWAGGWRLGAHGRVPVGPGLDPACTEPGMPAARGMCGTDLGVPVSWRIPVSASNPNALTVHAVSGAGRPGGSFAVRRTPEALEATWQAGVAGRFDALGLPLILLVGPEEAALARVLAGAQARAQTSSAPRQ